MSGELCPTLVRRLAGSFDVMALAIGGWLRFMSGTDHDGRPIEGIKDPAGGDELVRLAKRVVAEPSAASVEPVLLNCFNVKDSAAAGKIAAAVAELDRGGTKAALAKFARK
jgi:mannitol-1-phosphate/altronate dehydrogenase